jgi:hypothetical protein
MTDSRKSDLMTMYWNGVIALSSSPKEGWEVGTAGRTKFIRLDKVDAHQSCNIWQRGRSL